MAHRARRSSSTEVILSGMVDGVLGLLAAIMIAFVFLGMSPRDNALSSLILLILGSVLLFVDVFLFFARRGNSSLPQLLRAHSISLVSKYFLLTYSIALFIAGLALLQN